MKRFFYRISCLLLLTATLLCGCGKEQEKSHTKLGMEAIENLQYQEALKEFEQGLLAEENQRLIYRGQGLAYLGLTQYGEAAASLEKCLSVSSCIPDELDYDVNYYLATALIKDGRLEEAKQIYDNILALRKEDRDAYFLRGSVLLRMGEYNQAKPDFDKAVALDPTNYDQLVELYKMLDDAGYGEAGILYLQNTVSNPPKDMSNYDKGRMYFFLDDFKSAQNYLEQAMNAGDAQATYYLGKSWENLGEYNYAASVYDSYLKDMGESALIYNELALCKVELEDYDGALEAIQKGLKMEGNEIRQTLSFNEITIYESMGDFKKAAMLMNNYLRSYPDDEDAKREYEFLRTR